ncbi:MAG: flagellar hook assembly protein FlgD [bacterium]
MQGSAGITDPTATVADPSKNKETGLTALSTAEASKQQFLTLLVAQLEHQDPLDPMKGSDFTAQLAQFSALEQLININKSLDALSALKLAISQSQAVDMIGKQIIAEGNAISIAGGVSSDLVFNLEASADQTSIGIFNAMGELVNSAPTGALPAGRHTIPFSARDTQGSLLPDGVYTFQVLATGADGEDVTPVTFSTGIVSGVMIKEGATLLTIGPSEVNLSEVVEITNPASAPQEEATAGGAGAAGDEEPAQ